MKRSLTVLAGKVVFIFLELGSLVESDRVLNLHLAILL